MKIKCCDQFRRPKVKFSANMSDLIGLSVFLCMMLGLIGFVVYGVGEILLENLSDGIVAEEFQSCYENSSGRRRLSGCVIQSSLVLSLLFFVAVWFVLPRFLNACGYLINYKLRIESRCYVCERSEVICDLPNIQNDQ